MTSARRIKQRVRKKRKPSPEQPKQPEPVLVPTRTPTLAELLKQTKELLK